MATDKASLRVKIQLALQDDAISELRSCATALLAVCKLAACCAACETGGYQTEKQGADTRRW